MVSEILVNFRRTEQKSPVQEKAVGKGFRWIEG